MAILKYAKNSPDCRLGGDDVRIPSVEHGLRVFQSDRDCRIRILWIVDRGARARLALGNSSHPRHDLACGIAGEPDQFGAVLGGPAVGRDGGKWLAGRSGGIDGTAAKGMGGAGDLRGSGRLCDFQPLPAL